MSQAALNENVPTVWGYTLKCRIKRKTNKETKNQTNKKAGTWHPAMELSPRVMF